jgi:ribose transport system substrate-binding protein
MTIRQFVRSCALPVALLPLLSCAGSQHAGDEKYYFVASNVKIPYWETAKNGFMRGISAMKVKGEFIGPEKYDPAEEQKDFQQAVKAKPAGILLSAADASLLKGDIDAAIAAGIPVVTVDSDSPGSKRLFFVGTNNYEAGRIGGRRLAEILKGKGNVVVYTIPGQANVEERLKGYKDALSDHPGIKIVDVIDFKGESSLAFDKTQELLGNKKQQVDAFVCLEALAGQEVAEVINRAKATDKTIMAFDTNDETVKWIQQGVIAATIAQKPWSMSYVGLQLLDQVHHNPPKTLDGNFRQDPFSVLPDFVDTGATLIDKSNVAAFLQARESSKAQ